MSRLPKRVWSWKKLVFSGKKAVREKDWQIWVYKPKFEEIDSWEVYTNKRETLDSEAPLDVYDSSKPEYIGTMEDGILATYTFYDHNRSVLKQDTCKDGETPIPPADPTRESDWEYDYQFTWWDPEVWPITKDTDYVALYNATKRIYTVYVSVNDSSYWSVDITELPVEAWTEILDSSLEPTLQPNQLMVGSTVITATAESWYEFDYWTNWSQVITWDEYPQAVFKVATPIESPLYTRCDCWTDQWINYMTLSFLDEVWELMFGINYNMSDSSYWIDQWSSSYTTSISVSDIQDYVEPVFNLSDANVYNNLWLDVTEAAFWDWNNYVGIVSNSDLKDYIYNVLEDVTTDSSAIRTLLSTEGNLCITWFQNENGMGTLMDDWSQVYVNSWSPLDAWWCYLDGLNNIEVKEENGSVVVVVDPGSWYYGNKLGTSLKTYFEGLTSVQYATLLSWGGTDKWWYISPANIGRCIVVVYFYQDDNYANTIWSLLNEYLPSGLHYGDDLIAWQD